jgi:hypothetical protein
MVRSETHESARPAGSKSRADPAEQAWQDYCRGLRAMLPREEVQKLTSHEARDRHFARWKRLADFAARHRALGSLRLPEVDVDDLD